MSFTYVQVITVSSELSFFSRWISIVSRIMVITLAEHRTLLFKSCFRGIHQEIFGLKREKEAKTASSEVPKECFEQ